MIMELMHLHLFATPEGITLRRPLAEEARPAGPVGESHAAVRSDGQVLHTRTHASLLYALSGLLAKSV